MRSEFIPGSRTIHLQPYIFLYHSEQPSAMNEDLTRHLMSERSSHVIDLPAAHSIDVPPGYSLAIQVWVRHLLLAVDSYFHEVARILRLEW